jgi:cytochrome P450
LFSHDVAGQTDTVAGAMDALRRSIGIPDLLPSWMPSPPRSRIERAVSDLDAVIQAMIAERRTSARPPDPPDLLQLLIEAKDEEGDGGGLGDAEIRDQLVTLFLAGHETTSHALSWTLFLLSDNAEAEAALHRELDEVLGGRRPRYQDLERLVYTAQVFDEAMRLYPPAYTLARRAEEDTDIGGYPVPRGSEVIIWTYHTHRDERWYPDSERFSPERFAAQEVAARPKLAYLPFGAGARACIGKSFALVEARLLLATLAQRFRFERVADHPVVPEPRVTLAPKHGIRMTLRKR